MTIPYRFEPDHTAAALHEEFASDKEQVERFRREARAVAKLAQSNIAVVIDRKLRSRGCGIACSLYLTHLQSAITICFVIGGG